MEFHENKMDIEFENPWNVEDLDDFLYYCCPECDLRDQSKIQFLQHALEQHSKSKQCVQQFNGFIIKDELNEVNDSDISENKFVSTIKSEPNYEDDEAQDENVQQIIQNVQIKLESSNNGLMKPIISQSKSIGSEQGGKKRKSYIYGTKGLSSKLRRCGECKGCINEDCGECPACIDMPRFGGKLAITILFDIFRFH